MSGDTPSQRVAEDLGVIMAQLIIKVLLHPSSSDAEMVDAWCRLVRALAPGYDPRPHFDAALEQRAGKAGES